MERYNLEKLVKIKCNNFYPAKFWTYKRKISIFGITLRKEGFYSNFKLYSSTIPEYHSLINGELFENPVVILYFGVNIIKCIYFDSYEKATEFAKVITLNGKWL